MLDECATGRWHIRFRDRDYTLRGSESRTLASVGAFRVVPAHDLRDTFDKPLDPRHGELWHLRDSGLVETVRIDRDKPAVTLTKEGRDLLEASRRDADSPDRQTFTHGVQRPRELKHDAEVYRAYLEEAERLHDVDANIHRVVLENELKAEYQEFLQERNRDRDDSDGRPDRDPSEIQDWAREHDPPCDDQGHVQFPDVRIEYDIDGRDHTLDVEVMTPHYRGAHAAAKFGSGFTGVYRFTRFPVSPLGNYMEAVLWPQVRRPDVVGVISHQSALPIHELSDVSPARVHVTLPTTVRIRREVPKGLVIHHADLGPADVERVEGVPVTTPARSIRDAHASHLGNDLVGQAIADGRRSGVLSIVEAGRLQRELLGTRPKRPRATPARVDAR